MFYLQIAVEIIRLRSNFLQIINIRDMTNQKQNKPRVVTLEITDLDEDLR